jgi:hypothetical protein
VSLSRVPKLRGWTQIKIRTGRVSCRGGVFGRSEVSFRDGALSRSGVSGSRAEVGYLAEVRSRAEMKR